jgi:hypothetical protein
VLNTLAYNISTRAGRYTTPDVRTKNVELPGRHGTLRVRRKRYQQGQFVLNMWVKGANPDGSIPDSFNNLNRRLFQENLDTLMQIFTRKSGLLDIRQTLPDGSVRQCFGEVLAVIDPQSKSVQPMAVFSVAITVPAVFWQDLNPVTYQSSFTLGTNTTLTLTPFLGATAPMSDLVWTITGACTSPKVQMIENGAPLEVDTWMQYNGSVPSTKKLTVDAGAWSVTGDIGFTVSTANLVHVGDSAFMTLEPGPNITAPQVVWTASGVDANTSLKVVGRRKYVVV